MVDYSKWDKLDVSDEEDVKPKKPPEPVKPKPRRLHPLDYHPERSLHKELFEPKNCMRWVHPSLLQVLNQWQSGKKTDEEPTFQSFNVAIEGFKVEAPGIFSFPALTDEFCELLLQEVQHYRKSGLPSRAPNSMNNYGLVLNEIGMRPAFSAILKEVLLPIGARLFGSDEDRIKEVNGVAIESEDWGGSTLDDHHSFIVQYRPSDDKHLDMHIDECDVTFNFGITSHNNFEGNDLTFCGMFDSADHRKYHHTYKHVKGRCVVHSGKRRHGAMDIEKGERASLIMWTKSRSFRRTEAYRERNRKGLTYGDADRVCLSYTHDPDYKNLMPKKQQYHMKPREEGQAGNEVPLQTEKKWITVCPAADLSEGQSKLLNLKEENEQIAVFKHREELFALDNRCAHMGGSLCEGEIEDVGKENLGCSDSKATDGMVICPRHYMCFNLKTGENVEGDFTMKQKVYPVRLSSDGQHIEVEVELEVLQPLVPTTPENPGVLHAERPFSWLCGIPNKVFATVPFALGICSFAIAFNIIFNHRHTRF
ncbi:2-oxoglutarate and iron-dependent oxygenase domain-containing protein ICU11 (Protein INCURVATA 11) [Durusdinium trenchii]|uniref:2-oxoglutarate and iron-dependent oxygenase domain-containing protein ICU11 (Protein INCURVATA 11) n=2 Tax=Durusdinium trenchii TaxID=1381693 RepID=A0ABP0MYP2_9DINO